MRRIVSGLALALALAATSSQARGDDQSDEQAKAEAQMGDQLYHELVQQGEVVQSSPLYDVLRPIAEPIARAAETKYHAPIRFYIVHEAQPNAFAAPGGNVYVVDSLLYFVHNAEELAGTLCHETSHLIYHDSYHKLQEQQHVAGRVVGASILLGPRLGTVLALGAIGQLDQKHYSRDVEERADLTGADTCAAAGSNPWGLVWLFRDFARADLKQPPEILSDHPDDQHRIAALEQHLRADPATFGRYRDDSRRAKAMVMPRDQAEQFVR
ncbi:MAG TPA: M48 family metalloprotease [Candidatus Elarobacter sp.]|nr:M48 family metalloprotease [Candidatus Elarobacter sp.]